MTAPNSYARPAGGMAAERRAILTRAADQEARRQAARERGDAAGAQAAEDELRRLWRRFGELGHT